MFKVRVSAIFSKQFNITNFNTKLPFFGSLIPQAMTLFQNNKIFINNYLYLNHTIIYPERGNS